MAGLGWGWRRAGRKADSSSPAAPRNDTWEDGVGMARGAGTWRLQTPHPAAVRGHPLPKGEGWNRYAVGTPPPTAKADSSLLTVIRPFAWLRAVRKRKGERTRNDTWEDGVGMTHGAGTWRLQTPHPAAVRGHPLPKGEGWNRYAVGTPPLQKPRGSKDPLYPLCRLAPQLPRLVRGQSIIQHPLEVLGQNRRFAGVPRAWW